MLEMLLMQYEDVFGKPFPLADFAGHQEIEILNILYDCVLTGNPNWQGRDIPFRLGDAPGQEGRNISFGSGNTASPEGR